MGEHLLGVQYETLGPRILFVDDSATDRARGAGLIAGKHPEWTVIQTACAEDGLARLNEDRFDAVVSDIVMPNMDGREFLRTINQKFVGLPVVLITAQGNDRIAAECVELGAVNYVPKRCMAENLVPALEDVITAQQEVVSKRRVLQHVVQNCCEFEIQNDLDQIRSLINFLRDRLSGFERFTTSDIQSMTVAVRESLLNAYFHGNLEANSRPLQHTRDEYMARAIRHKSESQYSDRRIRLEINLGPDEITFRISDQGKGFERTIVSELTGPPDDQLPAGNGFRQIQKAMDSVSFNAAGNTITLARSVSNRHSEPDHPNV
ncbi:MAG: response regulator [Fuerstiella sp.]|nr:response regulator [Fuerstiella sp.]